MKTEMRRQEIYNHISVRKTLRIADLKQLFRVSEVTIRSDLDYLESAGKVRRSHGKASLVPAEEKHSTLPDTPMLESKIQICKRAIEFVKTGDTLFLDSSATSIILSSILSDIPNITVITNCLAIINRLKNSNGIQLYPIPGLYNHTSDSFTGPLAESFIGSLKTGKAFLSPKGIIEEGLRDLTAEEAAIRRAMIESTKEAIILADHSKFHNFERILFQISDFTKISTVITDQMPPEPFSHLFRDKQIQVVI